MTNTHALTPDLDAACRYAFDLLARQLPASCTYHSLWHTRDDVAPSVARLARLSHVGAEDQLLLQTAACFHDLGFIQQRHAHEQIGAAIAEAALPGFHYAPAQIAVIVGMIMATRMPQSPKTALEELLADADLDLLGREDFIEKNQALRAELAANDQQFSDREWYTSQLAFLRAHHYWSPAARGLRDAGKLRNIALMEGLLRSV